MTDKDNITLPREVVELALDALEWSWGGEPMGTKEREAITALRTALAAEQPKPKPEPVASDDDEEFTREDVTTLLLEVMDWTYAQAHRNRPMTEAEQKVLDDIRTALAAEQPKPSEDIEALRRDAERYKWVLGWLVRTGLLSREKTRIDTPESFGDWFVLRKPHSIGLSVGYGETEDAAIDAAMERKR